MLPDRMKSVSSLLKEVISEVIREEIKDPRVSDFVSVTETRPSRDLRSARVLISVLGDREAGLSAVEGLNKARGFIKRRIRQEMTIKRIPDLTFHLDESIKRGVRISTLIDQVREEDKKIEGEEE